jgi:hypothetical protein
VGIIDEILDGGFDGQLEDMRDAINERRSILGQRKLHRDLQVGDIVRFVNLGMGAKYLNGIRARIDEINRKTVWVRILPEDRVKIAGTRFGRTSRIKVYPNSIELDHLDGIANEPFPKLAVKNVTP